VMKKKIHKGRLERGCTTRAQQKDQVLLKKGKGEETLHGIKDVPDGFKNRT